jgi:DNA-binding LacI/PurR family transcriptional regulator
MTMSRSDKIRGFHAAASEAGLGEHVCVVEGGPVNEYGDSVIGEVGRDLARRIVKADARPTGIVAVNDLMALGLMAGLREMGLSVPRDMSLVGMDGLFLSAISNPALTTVQLPVTEMARAMVDRAMTRQSDPAKDAGELVFTPTVLVERESVGPPPANVLAAGTGSNKAKK